MFQVFNHSRDEHEDILQQRGRTLFTKEKNIRYFIRMENRLFAIVSLHARSWIVTENSIPETERIRARANLF